MPDAFSELVEIAKLNGDFQRNYGKLVGGFLYLRSIRTVRGRTCFVGGLLAAMVSIVATWLGRHGLSWLDVG
jgi:hypothetical protein